MRQQHQARLQHQASAAHRKYACCILCQLCTWHCKQLARLHTAGMPQSHPHLSCTQRQSLCSCMLQGDSCTYSHGVYECWLHPAKYRTQLCKDGGQCRRPVCFFAHSVPELRSPTYTWDGNEVHPYIALQFAVYLFVLFCCMRHEQCCTGCGHLNK